MGVEPNWKAPLLRQPVPQPGGPRDPIKIDRSRNRRNHIISIPWLTDGRKILLFRIISWQSHYLPGAPKEDVRLWARESVQLLARDLGKTRRHVNDELIWLRKRGVLFIKRTGHWSYYHVAEETQPVWTRVALPDSPGNGCRIDPATDAGLDRQPLPDLPSVPLPDSGTRNTPPYSPVGSHDQNALSVVSPSAPRSERPATPPASIPTPNGRTRTDWCVCSDGTLEITVPIDRRVFYAKTDKAFCRGKPHREVEEFLRRHFQSRGMDSFSFRFISSIGAGGVPQPRKTKCPGCGKTHESTLVHNFCPECFGTRSKA